MYKRQNKDTSSQSPFQRKDDEWNGNNYQTKHHSEQGKKYSSDKKRDEDELKEKFDKKFTSEKKRINDEWKEKFDKKFSSDKKRDEDELEKNKLNKSYKSLELEQSATAIQIKNQYRKLIKFYHPDNFQKTPEKLEHSEKKTKEITSAYEILKNAGKLN